MAAKLGTTVLHLSLRREDVDLDDNSKLLSRSFSVPLVFLFFSFSSHRTTFSRLTRDLRSSLVRTEVDCLPGDIIQVIQIDGEDHDEDAFLNNSDEDDDFTDFRRRQEGNSGFGGTRLGGGGGRAANGNGNGNRSREPSAASGAEDDWDLDANLGLDQQDVAMAGAAAGGGKFGICPTCSESTFSVRCFESRKGSAS